MRNLAFPGAFSLRVRYSQLLNVPSENENWHSNRHATGCDPCRAICVQRFDDSLNSAIHITYRSSLRSSSMHEPRDPPLKVVKFVFLFLTQVYVISIYLLKQRERGMYKPPLGCPTLTVCRPSRTQREGNMHNGAERKFGLWFRVITFLLNTLFFKLPTLFGGNTRKTKPKS